MTVVLVLWCPVWEPEARIEAKELIARLQRAGKVAIHCLHGPLDDQDRLCCSSCPSDPPKHMSQAIQDALDKSQVDELHIFSRSRFNLHVGDSCELNMAKMVFFWVKEDHIESFEHREWADRPGMVIQDTAKVASWEREQQFVVPDLVIPKPPRSGLRQRKIKIQ